MHLCGIRAVDDEHLLLLQTLGLLHDSLKAGDERVIRYCWRDFRGAVIDHMQGETQFFHLLPKSAAATHLAAHAHTMAMFQAYRVDAPDPGRTNLLQLVTMVEEHTTCPEELLLLELLTVRAAS
jgi:hypothetical protein